MEKQNLKCECGATARNTSKESGRFKRRHLGNCKYARPLTVAKQLAADVRSVLADEARDFEGGQS